MVWGGIGANGTTSLHFCDRNMDSQYYQHVLEENYLPFHQQDFVFLQDNATPHASESTKEFFRQHNIKVLGWAASSRDYNRIEHLWAILVRRVYEGGKVYHFVEDLKDAMQKVWDELEIVLITDLVKSFPKRLIQVVEAKGGPTKSY